MHLDSLASVYWAVQVARILKMTELEKTNELHTALETYNVDTPLDEKDAALHEKDHDKEKDSEHHHDVTVTGPIILDDSHYDDDHLIVTGADASNYLLSIRDDGDPALTVRSMVLGTLVAAFQASMNQIYMVR